MSDVGTTDHMRRDHQRRPGHRAEPSLVCVRRRFPVRARRVPAFDDFLVRELLHLLRSQRREGLAFRRLRSLLLRLRHFRGRSGIRPQLHRILHCCLSGGAFDRQLQITLGHAARLCVEFDIPVGIRIEPVIALRPIGRARRHDFANRVGDDLHDNSGICVGRDRQRVAATRGISGRGSAGMFVPAAAGVFQAMSASAQIGRIFSATERERATRRTSSSWRTPGSVYDGRK